MQGPPLRPLLVIVVVGHFLASSGAVIIRRLPLEAWPPPQCSRSTAFIIYVFRVEIDAAPPHWRPHFFPSFSLRQAKQNQRRNGRTARGRRSGARKSIAESKEKDWYRLAAASAFALPTRRVPQWKLGCAQFRPQCLLLLARFSPQ